MSRKILAKIDDVKESNKKDVKKEDVVKKDKGDKKDKKEDPPVKWGDRVSEEEDEEEDEEEEEEEEEEVSGDASEAGSESDTYVDETSEPKHAKKSFEKYEKKPFRPAGKGRSEAMNFSYKDYSSPTTKVSDTSSVDLLRTVYVRAHFNGQLGLKNCASALLRAMNLECPFPTIVHPPMETAYISHPRQDTYNPRGRDFSRGRGFARGRGNIREDYAKHQ